MIPAIVLDPSLFWMFQDNASDADILADLGSILDWLSKDIPRARYVLSHRAIDKLYELGKIPFEPRLHDLIQRADLADVFNPKDVAGLLNRVVSTAGGLSELGGVADVLLDNLLVEPNLAIVDENLSVLSRECLALVAANIMVGAHCVYAMPKCISEKVVVSGSLAIVEPPQLIDGLPVEISIGIDVVRRRREFFDHLDPQELWFNGEDLECLYLAILAKAYSLSGDGDIREFVLGQDFHHSLVRNQGYGTTYAKTFLKNCGEVVANAPSLAVSDFYDGPASTSKPVVRLDGARAKRVHVTESGVGFRLMFWERISGVVELANIGPKSEEMIS